MERAVNLCTQTQDLARGDQAVPQRIRFPQHTLVDEVGQVLRPDGLENLHWCNEVPDDLEVDVDRERLYRMFLNLGRNAVDAMNKQGVIRIGAIRTEMGVRIDVADSGPGIPECIRAHLFEPFVGSARPGGMGLGLATARDLVRAPDQQIRPSPLNPRGQFVCST